MEEIANAFSGKGITESSKKLYLANLKRLNGGEIKNLKFLADVKSVMEKLEKYKPNTQRSYIISIVSLLKTLKGTQKKYQKLYDEYYKILEQQNVTLKDQTGKTDKENENWIGQDKIKGIFEDKMKIIEAIKSKKKIGVEEYDDLLHLVVLSLFVLQKPRRNKDYQEMVVVKKYKPEYGTEQNFLDLSKSEFQFNNYKTAGTYKTQIVPVEPKMREIIDAFLKHHPLKKQLKTADAKVSFLVDYQGNPFTQINSLTRMLYKIFGTKIGSSMMRKLYLTDKYSAMMAEMKDDAEAMGTSTSTAQSNYIKKE